MAERPARHPEQGRGTGREELTMNVKKPTNWRAWLVRSISLPVLLDVWGGWVDLGERAGFGAQQLLPKWAPWLKVDTAVALPFSVEIYAGIAAGVWFDRSAPAGARKFAKITSLAAFGIGFVGQSYDRLVHDDHWPIPSVVVVLLNGLLIGALACGAILIEKTRDGGEEAESVPGGGVPAEARPVPAQPAVPVPGKPDVPEKPAVPGTGGVPGPAQVHPRAAVPERSAVPETDRVGPVPERLDVPAPPHPPALRAVPGPEGEEPAGRPPAARRPRGGLTAEVLARAERVFREDIDQGVIPGVRLVKARMSVGQPAAVKIQAHLRAVRADHRREASGG